MGKLLKWFKDTGYKVIIVIILLIGVGRWIQRVEEVVNSFSKIEDTLSKIEDTLISINAKTNTLTEFKTRMIGKIDDISEKVNNIDKRLVRVETRVNRIEGISRTTKDTVSRLARRWDLRLRDQLAYSQRIEERLKDMTHTLAFWDSPLLDLEGLRNRNYAFLLVEGTVYQDSVSKKPISGALIVIKDYPQYSTSTSSEGKFLLSVPRKATRLSILASGFKKKVIDLPKEPSREVNLGPIYLMEE